MAEPMISNFDIYFVILVQKDKKRKENDELQGSFAFPLEFIINCPGMGAYLGTSADAEYIYIC
jgi:hypothetical protein